MVFLLHSYDAACDDNRASSKRGQLRLRGFKFPAHTPALAVCGAIYPALFRENHPFNRTITSPVYHSSIALEAYRKK
jgi:hypothetical protein